MILDSSKNCYLNTIRINTYICSEELKNKDLNELEIVLKTSHENLQNRRIDNKYISNADKHDDLFMRGAALDVLTQKQGIDYALKVIVLRRPETFKEKTKAFLQIQEYFPLK